MNTNTFGEKLREYREQHDLSQQELADILGTTKQVLSRYETGQRDPKITTVAEYANRLGLPLSYFLDDPLVQDTTAPSKHDDLTPFEREVLKALRSLTEAQQQSLLDYLRFLLSTQSP